MIRVLIVDDSAIARQAISAILHSASGIEVIGEAADGVEAVEMAAQFKPDVITMGINMPRMDGQEATRRIMATTPIPILVVTTVTHQEVVHRGLQILLEGALDIVQKPSNRMAEGFNAIETELISKVKSVSQIRFPRPSSQDQVLRQI